MDLTRAIDIYCERTGPEFWSEPVNALTNLSFFAAAYWAWRLAEREGKTDPVIVMLVLMTAAVGTGSFLFHTFAEIWSAMADVWAIYLFSLTYALVALRRFFGLRPVAVVFAMFGIIAALYFVSTYWPASLMPNLPDLNGSEAYAPAVAFQIGLTTVLAISGNPAWRGIAAAAVTFLISLGFRSFDFRICDSFPLGSHFAWHVLNGLVFVFLLGTLIRHDQRPEAEPAPA